MSEFIRLDIKYTENTIRKTKHQLKKEILEAVESSPELRKEVRRVFQMANRRIQNLERAGLVSWAVKQADKLGIKGYSKFSVKGQDWATIKNEYTRAISFLQNPNSTAEGARQLEKTVREVVISHNRKFQDDALWNANKNLLVERADTVANQIINNSPYQEQIQEGIWHVIKSVSDDIETEGKVLANDLQAGIEKAADNLAGQVDNDLSKTLEAFKRWL